jgi:protease I
MDLTGVKIAIIATDLFEAAELFGPKSALEEAGAEITVIAPHEGSVQGVNHHDDADEVGVDETLDEAEPGDFDAVLLPGGAMNADELRTNPQAQAFVKSMDMAGKALAVICHGAWLLIEADLVRGHTVTSWPSIKTDLKNAGADWVDEVVVTDGNWVSSRKPADVEAFTTAFIKLIATQNDNDSE